MNKQEQIEKKLAKPIEVGDYVQIKVPYSYKENVTEGKGKKKITKSVIKETVFTNGGTVTKILPKTKHGLVYEIQLGSVRIPMEVGLTGLDTRYENSVKHDHFKAEHVSPTTLECGANSFKKERFRVNFYNQNISTILFKACYGRRDDDFNTPKYDVHTGVGGEHDKQFKGYTHGGVDFNPHVIDSDGNKQFYQRDLVWTLEQKQMLVDSIYNGIEIGKFLFRYKSWKKIEEGMAKDGHGYSWDCVDGKQRFFAILHFVQNKYPDSNGNYWNDLSPIAQNKFLEYGNLSYGEMGEQATDNDVIETFLTLNFTGTPMSKEHIEFVQTFKMG